MAAGRTYTLRPRRSRWGAVGLAAGVFLLGWLGLRGCATGIGVKTGDDPVAAHAGDIDPVNAPDFAFAMGEGSGWHGFDIIRVGADGGCEYTFLDSTDGLPVQDWKRATFRTDSSTVADLRRLVRDVNFFRLKKSYSSGAADGTQWFVKVDASGWRKGVWCDNYFPTEVRRLSAFVRERLLGPNQPALRTAARVDLKAEDLDRDFYYGEVQDPSPGR